LKFILREQFFSTDVWCSCTRSSSATVSSDVECVQCGCPLLRTVLSEEGVASFFLKFSFMIETIDLVHLRNPRSRGSDADDEMQSFYWHWRVLCTFAPKVEIWREAAELSKERSTFHWWHNCLGAADTQILCCLMKVCDSCSVSPLYLQQTCQWKLADIRRETTRRYRDADASFPVILNLFSAVWRLSLSRTILRTEWHLLKWSFMIETVEWIETNGRFIFRERLFPISKIGFGGMAV
jgi:hypothetical protein